jgi:acetyl-CoA carboxylase biotin carboxylase subunit
MIRRLLIANRGEIAVRIIAACRELGIETVAIYSEADARALHVKLADQAIKVGPARSAESYLNIPAVIAAAESARADAVHPGYGFLSQNAAFARACHEARLTFVGPPAQAIEQMGSKIEARRLMRAAGVPVVPGETPADQTDGGIRAALERAGVPALIKASAGGGGKGMRVVRALEEAVDAITAARREAVSSFGDGTLYIERLIEQPRHIEVQVFADQHGNVTHIFERECSAQRRHQKVIEETPAPGVTPALRESLTTAAVRAAAAVNYQNAGTVEFLVDSSGPAPRFYFLEMNTRLQVEHGVTELATGVDLVHAQLRIAAGERLPWFGESLSQRRHAIEARIYAEDPAAGFLPQAGRLLLYREPNLPGVRIDSGVFEGSEVSVHYDPLLAKVIATAETRDMTIARLSAALRSFPILGVQTNVSFLLNILEHPEFRAGRIDTGFLDRELGSFISGSDEVPEFVRAAMAAHVESVHAPQDVSRSAWDPWNGSRQ